MEVKIEVQTYEQHRYGKDWFNITWFLTKEEAENALAKMKGDAE